MFSGRDSEISAANLQENRKVPQSGLHFGRSSMGGVEIHHSDAFRSCSDTFPTRCDAFPTRCDAFPTRWDAFPPQIAAFRSETGAPAPPARTLEILGIRGISRTLGGTLRALAPLLGIQQNFAKSQRISRLPPGFEHSLRSPLSLRGPPDPAQTSFYIFLRQIKNST